MALIGFPDSLLVHTDGTRQLELAAEDYRALVAALDARFPGIAAPLEKLAVAIDGNIYQEPFLEPIKGDSEVYFLPRIEGG